jgi:hypothetical protein
MSAFMLLNPANARLAIQAKSAGVPMSTYEADYRRRFGFNDVTQPLPPEHQAAMQRGAEKEAKHNKTEVLAGGLALGGTIGAGLAGVGAGTAGGAAGLTAAEGAGIASGMSEAAATFTPEMLGLGGSSLASGATSGGGMWDWLDTLDIGMGDVPGYGGEIGGGLSGGDPFADLYGAFGDVPGYGAVTPDMVMEPASGGFLDLLRQYGGKAISGLDSLFGNASGGASRLLPGGGGFDTALATAPILAAINYARNQGPFDTSRLTSTYDQFAPESLAFEYDQNTARGRNALTSSLTNRGVMGSSFGNADLTNFQTSRDLGRRSLVNQGLAQRGNLAATLLDAQIKERGLKNDLYGRSLLALGNVFGGRNQAPVYA